MEGGLFDEPEEQPNLLADEGSETDWGDGNGEGNGDGAPIEDRKNEEDSGEIGSS